MADDIRKCTSEDNGKGGFGLEGRRGSHDSDHVDLGHRTTRLSARKNHQLALHQEAKPCTFVDAAAMKEKVREKLSQPKYNVFDFYHDTGVAQGIAKSGVFDKLTLMVIAFNALWIAIDTDMNDSAILLEAEAPFLIAENAFCAYFTFEWVVRFAAFRSKLDGRKDGWFVFDSIMVFMMVLETWIFTLLVLLIMPGGGGGGGNAGILRLARLMRLSRMARMGKLLRVMPELMIMIKGMRAACRSVFFTLLLLVIIMYIFAIAFVQLGDATEPGAKFFPAVPESMYNLLIFGVLLDNVGHLAKGLNDEPILLILFLSFILIAALTVMNMLVGVLCEVVSAVAATEQEEMLVNYVNGKLTSVMDMLDTDGGGSISKVEFSQIIDNAEAVTCLNDVGVDVMALIDLADYIFEDDDAAEGEVELDFHHFMDVVLQLRGTNQATVKDIVDLRKFVRKTMQDNQKQTSAILEKLDMGAKKSAFMLDKLRQSVQSECSPKLNNSDVDRYSFGFHDSLVLHEPSEESEDLECTADKERRSHGGGWSWSTEQSEGKKRGSKKRSSKQQVQNNLSCDSVKCDVSQDILPMLPPETPNGELLSPICDNVKSSWNSMDPHRQHLVASNKAAGTSDRGDPHHSSRQMPPEEDKDRFPVATSNSSPAHIPSPTLGLTFPRSAHDGRESDRPRAGVRTEL